jgi:molybdate-binding protein
VARWQVGLAAPPASRRRDRLGAALAGAAPTVQREAGAASQDAYTRALERAGAPVPRAAAYASSHLDAARIAVVLDAAAVTFEPAAIVHGMAFSPLETHDVQLWIARTWSDHPAAQALVETLGSSAFAARLAARSGYDVSDCGRRLRAA